MSRGTSFPERLHVDPAKTQISLRILNSLWETVQTARICRSSLSAHAIVVNAEPRLNVFKSSFPSRIRFLTVIESSYCQFNIFFLTLVSGTPFHNMTKTCLYNFDPLKSHFYIVKLRFTGVYIFFLFLFKNIDCGSKLEPPRRGGSNEYPKSMFWAEIYQILFWNFSFFWR